MVFKMCFGKKEDDPAAKKNAEIEKTLREDRKKAEREVKILLLGKHPSSLMERNTADSSIRGWRKWKVDSSQADDHPACWRFRLRPEEAVQGCHLQQSGTSIRNRVESYGRAGHQIRQPQQCGMDEMTCPAHHVARLILCLAILKNDTCRARDWHQ